MNGAELTIAKRKLARLFREFDTLTELVRQAQDRLDGIAAEIEAARLTVLQIESEREIRGRLPVRMEIE